MWTMPRQSERPKGVSGITADRALAILTDAGVSDPHAQLLTIDAINYVNAYGDLDGWVEEKVFWARDEVDAQYAREVKNEILIKLVTDRITKS